jgi:hypothetical protein
MSDGPSHGLPAPDCSAAGPSVRVGRHEIATGVGDDTDDYSLQYVASRPAKVGDKLVSPKFSNSITGGFAAVDEPNWPGAFFPARRSRSRTKTCLSGSASDCAVIANRSRTEEEAEEQRCVAVVA